MDWSLLAEAENAEDVAAGLQIFKDNIPEAAAEITRHMSQLFAVSSAMRALDTELDLSRYGKQSARITADLDMVLSSLQYTLDAARKMFGLSRYASHSREPLYLTIWDDLEAQFMEEGLSLFARLEKYYQFIQGLLILLRGEEDPEDRDMNQLYERLKRLLRRQEPRESDIERLQLQVRSRVTGRERARSQPREPPRDFLSPLTGSNPRPRSSSFGRPPNDRYRSYPSSYHQRARSPEPEDWDEEPAMPGAFPSDARTPPPAPEVPSSTFPSSSTRTYSSVQVATDTAGTTRMPHWATRVFENRLPKTAFRIQGQITKCLGRDEPAALDRLASDNFVQVVELSFESGDATVRLYWRPADHRARILFTTKGVRGRREHFCIQLTALKILRTESCLQLCRVNRSDGKLDLWANLRFTDYERMVLFYCTLVAMKRQDWVQTPQGLDDHFQPGEVEEYGGVIKDQNYLHAFRIFRDRDSGGVRVEATARRGAMQKVPIWTAFITQHVGNRSWVRQMSNNPKIVQLRDLQPYIFCDDYTPPKGRNGKFELSFTTIEDAESFVETFQSLRTR